MSSPSRIPIAITEAIQQQRYAEAVPLLEVFCQTHAGSPNQEYWQAQILLAKAYQATGRSKQAVVLCRQMVNSGHPKVEAWARQALTALGVAPAEVSIEANGSDTTTPVSQPVAHSPALTAEESAELLSAGNKALKRNHYAEAIEKLEAYCQGTDATAKDYEQAQSWLAKAYKGTGQIDKAVVLCKQLVKSQKPFIQIWAEQFLQTIAPDEVVNTASPDASSQDLPHSSSSTSSHSSSPSFVASSSNSPKSLPKAGRSSKRGVTLMMKGVASNLALASGVTLSLLCGMVLVLSLNLVLISGSENPTVGLGIAIAITIVFNVLVFFISPLIMDLVQNWLYGTRWVSITQVERQSPEAARVIRMVCQQKGIQTPRLGIIEDQNPTAFTYGSLPNSARLVVSQGLFTYLDDDEVATVYAHELGHIVHWDFAVMTLAATLVQITYLIYAYTREMADRLGDGDAATKVKNGLQSASLLAYVFYLAGEYLMLYLSRTREYYADHFAAEVTGNPNGLSRALVKIAYGILEEGQRSTQPSKVLQGTRALGISDPRSANFAGTAYRIASEPQKIGKVFLWDMFNPWAWWMELSSTHPLTGKRIRALTNYAEQLGLDSEFDMAHIVLEGRSLNRRKLYGFFALDVLLYWAEYVGGVLGMILGGVLVAIDATNAKVILSAGLLGFGLGLLAKILTMYPSFDRAATSDVLTLMSDPYASPLRGQPVKLTGQIIGRGDSGYRFGSDLKLQDSTGMIYIHYSSRFGPLGNFLFGTTQAESFIRQDVAVTGWFRRGTMPWVDFTLMTCPSKWNVKSYHRFWSLIIAAAAILLSFNLPI